MNPQSTRTRHPMARRRAWRHSEWWDVTNGCRDFWLYRVFFVCPLILLMVFDIWPQQVYWQIFALIARTIWMKKTRTGVQLGRETGIGVVIWKLCVFSSRWLWGEKTLKSQGFCHVLWNIVPIPLSHSSIGMFELLTVEIYWDPVEKSRPTTRCCILTASNVSKISKPKCQKLSILRCPGEGLPGLLGGYADADEVVVMWGVEPEKLISDLGVFCFVFGWVTIHQQLWWIIE